MEGLNCGLSAGVTYQLILGTVRGGIRRAVVEEGVLIVFTSKRTICMTVMLA